MSVSILLIAHVASDETNGIISEEETSNGGNTAQQNGLNTALCAAKLDRPELVVSNCLGISDDAPTFDRNPSCRELSEDVGNGY